MPQVFAKSNIKHNGALYKKGSVISNLTVEQAKALVLADSAEYVTEDNNPNDTMENASTEPTGDESTITDTMEVEISTKNTKKEILAYAESIGMTNLDPALQKAEMMNEINAFKASTPDDSQEEATEEVDSQPENNDTENE